MPKYKNADELKIAINRNMDMQDLYLPYEFINLIDEMPAADVVEVVRCKDCKFYKGRSCLNEELPICGDDMTEFIPDDNFYCSYGERRESE